MGGQRPCGDEIMDNDRAGQKARRKIGQFRIVASYYLFGQGDDARMLRRCFDGQRSLCRGQGRRAGSVSDGWSAVANASGSSALVPRRSQRQKTHTTGKRLAPLAQRLGKLIGIAHQEAAGAFAQGEVDQWSKLAANREKLRENTQHRAPRSR